MINSKSMNIIEKDFKSIITVDNIYKDIREIMSNNWNNIELINDINNILTHHENGKFIDKDMIDNLLNLKERLTEVMRATNELTACIKTKV